MSDIDFPGLLTFVVCLGLLVLAAAGLLLALVLRLSTRPLAAPIAVASLVLGVPAGLLAAAMEWRVIDGRATDRVLPLIVVGVLAAGLGTLVRMVRASRR